jgi:uncharacterized damage-inducible protein DinB
MRALVISTLLCSIVAPAFAQDALQPVIVIEGVPSSAPPVEQEATTVASVRFVYGLAKDYITRSAEKATVEHYAFRPTEEVRTFGGMLGHIADANYMFCSTAKGEENPNSRELESLTSRAELTQALAESFTYCDGAYAMSEEKAAESVDMFGQTLTRAGVLAFNAAHDYEHYGNLVTYMRINGIVPPSSER